MMMCPGCSRGKVKTECLSQGCKSIFFLLTLCFPRPLGYKQKGDFCTGPTRLQHKGSPAPPGKPRWGAYTLVSTGLWPRWALALPWLLSVLHLLWTSEQRESASSPHFPRPCRAAVGETSVLLFPEAGVGLSYGGCLCSPTLTAHNSAAAGGSLSVLLMHV